MKSKLFVFLIMICVLFTITAVSASDNQTDVISEVSEHSFTDLKDDINASEDTFDVKYDYKYADSDNLSEISINKTKLTINGNNHKIDASGKSSIFKVYDPGAVSSRELIINDLTFVNSSGHVIFSDGCKLTLNNVSFINNFKTSILNVNEGQLNINDCYFKSNAVSNAISAAYETNVLINNSIFCDSVCDNSYIAVNRGKLIVENSTFNNLTSSYGGAIEYRGGTLSVKKSKFHNLHAMTGGAILGKFFTKFDNGTYFGLEPVLIKDCSFENVSSDNNGGAIHFDLDSHAGNITKTLNIYNTNFTNCSSDFGGAIFHVGCILNIANSTFEKNCANYGGGAIYAAFCNLTLSNSNFKDNFANKSGGAIYFDNGRLTILGSKLENNTSKDMQTAIYANEVGADFKNSTFMNGGLSVYGVFVKSHDEENIKSTDEFSWENTNYIFFVENDGVKLNITKNEIITDKLPSRFDLRDWGWSTSIKNQGNTNTCWTFATMAAIESSLLRSTGIYTDLSENNFKSHQMKYFPQGDMRNSEIGFAYSSLGYALSWYGVVYENDDRYDERSLVSDISSTEKRIHIQDAMIIFGGRNDTNMLIKQALLKYGGVVIQFEPNPLGYFSGNFYSNETAYPEHFVTLIGWDDDYPVTNYYNPPSKPGAWIIKNSWGPEYGKDGYAYISYDDATFLAVDNHSVVPQRAAIVFIIENDIDYHVNYQSDLTGLVGFDGNYSIYSNEFTSKYSELIGAVGTYFNDSGIEYSFDVYVNGNLVHTQKGISEFAGFRTIVLNKYIPLKAGDSFKVVFRNNALPYQAFSRQHYIAGMSMVGNDVNDMSDISLQNKTVCLKVYTVADDTVITANKDISVDYDGGFYFSVKVMTSNGHAVGAGAPVKFTIAGKTYNTVTDSSGIAKIKITDVPKKYVITTTYNGKSYRNTVTVKQVLTASKVTVKKTAKKFTLKAKLKINGKLVKGKLVTFKLNGKTYKVKTNSKGVAQKTLGKKVIKKLKKGKTYTVKVTYLKDTIKTSAKVK